MLGSKAVALCLLVLAGGVGGAQGSPEPSASIWASDPERALSAEAPWDEPRAVDIPALGEAVVSDEPGRWGGGDPEAVANFNYLALPGRLSSPGLRGLWREGLDLERRGLLVASSRRYELIVTSVPEESYTYWRIARNYWRVGENQPLDRTAERGRYFDLSELWAARGLAVDPDCAACMLWKFVAMGRQATTRGLLTAVSDVREMDRLLGRGIELAPEHRDNDGNLTMANLYYAGSVFYRVVPEWRWLKWIIGVRGDKEKSLGYAREAVALSPVRVDYRVELGASLLCLGVEKDQPERLVEGRQILESSRRLDDFLSTDALDKRHAAILAQEPDKACGYSRDGFIDIDSLGKKVRGGG
ncbi:MAG: hypothetical protein P8Q97_11105 [Myxococcota bacterium]|nr:hypothetical protein [Myxococcota bacterium]